MRMLGSTPGGIATGVLHRGPTYNISLEHQDEGGLRSLTWRCYPVMFALVVLLALMSLWTEMFATERMATVLTFEWQKVDQMTELR